MTGGVIDKFPHRSRCKHQREPILDHEREQARAGRSHQVPIIERTRLAGAALECLADEAEVVGQGGHVGVFVDMAGSDEHAVGPDPEDGRPAFSRCQHMSRQFVPHAVKFRAFRHRPRRFSIVSTLLPELGYERRHGVARKTRNNPCTVADAAVATVVRHRRHPERGRASPRHKTPGRRPVYKQA